MTNQQEPATGEPTGRQPTDGSQNQSFSVWSGFKFGVGFSTAMFLVALAFLIPLMILWFVGLAAILSGD